MRILVSHIFSLVLLISLPAAGILYSGGPVGKYLEFPPLTRYVRHAGPCWSVFFGLASCLTVILAPFVGRFLKASSVSGQGTRPPGDFPWWGAVALLSCLISWVLAWNRFPWFMPFQPYTFIPLWFSFVVLVNALSHWRSGTSLMERSPGRFFLLFPVSTLFWWYFEYLNRFVQNWYYIGAEDFSPLGYCVTASVSFSTVLPSVLSVNEFLKGSPRFENAFESFLPLHLENSRAAAALILVFASAGLLGVGIFPDILFPLLWMAPLLVITSISFLFGLPHVFQKVPQGSWTGICRLAASGLICGFFWEMWNYYSYAKWIYSIPFVGQLKIFEMPVLGYAGYLPFGLECAVVASYVLGLKEILESRFLRTAAHKGNCN